METTDSPKKTAATDEVIDAIAEIEMQRRETEKTAGFVMSCSSALHRLQELHDHQKEALRLRGPDAGHAENVDVLRIEIGRVKSLAGPAGHGPAPKNSYCGERKTSWQDASRRNGRNRGRRTMGRAGGR